MNKQLWMIVDKLRNQGATIEDEEAESVYRFCIRKIEILGIKDKDIYMPTLYESEIRHALFRRTINAITIVKKIEMEMV